MSGLVSSIFGGGSASGGSASQTNSTTVNPPSYLEPYLSTAAGNANNAYSNYIAQGLNQPYSGAPSQVSSNISALTPQATSADIAGENAGLNAANLMNGQQQNTNNIASGLQSNIANGMLQQPSQMAFSPMSDSSLNASIQGAVAPLQENLQQTILPSLTSTAIADGAYGGNRMGVADNTALQNFSNSENQAASQADLSMEEQNNSLSEQNLANRITAGTAGNAQTLTGDALIPSLQETGAQQGATQSSLDSAVGTTQRGFDANNIAANMQNYSSEQAAPYGGLGTLEQLLQGTNSGSTSTTSVPNPGLLSQITAGLGGVNSLASILGGLNGTSSTAANLADPLAGSYGVAGGTTSAVDAAGDSVASSGTSTGISSILSLLGLA